VRFDLLQGIFVGGFKVVEINVASRFQHMQQKEEEVMYEAVAREIVSYTKKQETQINEDTVPDSRFAHFARLPARLSEVNGGSDDTLQCAHSFSTDGALLVSKGLKVPVLA
jgi:hypothetical protein